jgi:tetratricopeptide (TPR) repeat protein
MSKSDSAPPRVVARGKRSVGIGGNVRASTIVTGALYQFPFGRRYAVPVLAFVAVLLIGAAIVLVQQVRPASNAPTRMTGAGTKLAIARFTSGDPRGDTVQNRADDLARMVQSSLDAQSSGAALQTWSPDRTGSIASAATAEQRARDINADLIVYTTVDLTEDATRVHPKYYLAAAAISDAPELAGEYDLGDDISSLGDFNRNTVTFEDLRQRLTARITVLEQVVYGLSRYQRQDFAAAATAFRSAEDPAIWPGNQGKAVVWLYAGYAAAALGDVGAARTYFERAEAYAATRPRAESAAATLP